MLTDKLQVWKEEAEQKLNTARIQKEILDTISDHSRSVNDARKKVELEIAVNTDRILLLEAVEEEIDSLKSQLMATTSSPQLPDDTSDLGEVVRTALEAFPDKAEETSQPLVVAPAPEALKADDEQTFKVSSNKVTHAIREIVMQTRSPLSANDVKRILVQNGFAGANGSTVYSQLHKLHRVEKIVEKKGEGMFYPTTTAKREYARKQRQHEAA